MLDRTAKIDTITRRRRKLYGESSRDCEKSVKLVGDRRLEASERESRVREWNDEAKSTAKTRVEESRRRPSR